MSLGVLGVWRKAKLRNVRYTWWLSKRRGVRKVKKCMCGAKASMVKRKGFWILIIEWATRV